MYLSEPKGPAIPEKPFSMFGSKGKSKSIEESQLQVNMMDLF